MSSTNNPASVNIPPRRLGECLQTAGLLTAEQLNEAIEYQCIYGGKLGTTLIELGLLDEDQLAKALSQQLQLHYIKSELLMDVPATVLALIPRKTALEYQVVPYRKDGKKLYVAMNEVSNLTAIDELSFQLDHIITPLAIPEVRLMLALQKHYGMLLTPRFETLAKQMKRRKLAAQKKAPKKNTVKNIESIHNEMTKSVSSWPLLGDENFPGEEPDDACYFAVKSTVTGGHSASLLQQLAEAKERDDIAAAIINHLKQDFPNCALLMVRADTVTGWLASNNKSSQTFAHINIPILENSVFNHVATNNAHYLGPVGDSMHNHKILDYFAAQPPVNALVIPLMVRNRLVSILYVQGNFEDLERRQVAIQTIVAKAEMSFQILIMRNKILSV